MPDLPVPRRGVDVESVASTSTDRGLVARLKQRIRESQARAARALNTELVMLYWSIGRDILAQQQAAGWGDDIVGRIAEDLRVETGSVRGFSRRNLFYMRRFAAVWPEAEKVQTLSAQIGWSHHQVLLDAWADQPELYLWYAAKAAENRWSVRQLQGQIALGLHERHGAAVTNFAAALEPADADQALQTTKDPYVFDFLDLLSSTTHALRRFVVIELKIGKFQPEFVSKMNFYLNAVDEELRLGDDRESVGIILCADRDETVAKLALHRVYAPIAVSTWKAGTPPPELPAVEITDEVPADLGDLSELDTVRTRLIERVVRRAPEIAAGDD